MTIKIFTPVLTEEERALEEKACDVFLKVARKRASRRADPYRWYLEEEEVFGELQLKLAYLIDRYLHCVEWEVFERLVHRSFSNREKDLLRMAFGTSREREYTALALGDDILIGSYSQHVFIMEDFVKPLSELAGLLVRLVLEPDERMRQEIRNYIAQRKTKYKGGAGIDGIPEKVFVKATGRSHAVIKAACKEIKAALDEEEKVMDDITELLNSIDFEGSLIYEDDVDVPGDGRLPYIQWRGDDLVAQHKFRHPDMEIGGWRRSKIAKSLKEYDLQQGHDGSVAAVSLKRKVSPPPVIEDDEDEFGSPSVEEEVGEDLDDFPSDDEDEDDYEEFGPFNGSKNDKADEDELDDEDEFAPPKKKAPSKAVETVESEVKEEPVAEVEKERAEVPESKLKGLEGSHVIEKDVILVMLEHLRAGESIEGTVTKLGPNSYHFHITLSKTEDKPEMPKAEKVETVAKASAKKSNAKNKKENGKKSGKEMTAEYLEFRAWLKKTPRDKVIATALAEGAVWERTEDERVDYMQATIALRAERGIEKWKS